MQDFDLPSQVFGIGSDDYELYEEDDEFVLSIEMPGFEREEIDVNFYEGRLHVAAESEKESRRQKKTYHRTFRLPKEIEPDEITARYRNGVLEVHLPILTGAVHRGHTIEVEG
jgi:HSP20 family protein